ncbi:MAG: hypothetical protein ACXU86_12710 [Archangium sp.]
MTPSPKPLCLVLFSLMATGCASQQPHTRDEGTVASTSQASTGTLPPCAGATSRIERPAELPASFPLPPGTVMTTEEHRSGGRLIVHAVAPSDAKAVARFFERELPAAGFRITGGESEPGEAEAHYEGSGHVGRWTAREVGGCPGAVAIDVLVAPSGS